jgi:SAM-dependent methyltransferase
LLGVDAEHEEVGVLRLQAEQLVANRAPDEIRVEPEPADVLLNLLSHALITVDPVDELGRAWEENAAAWIAWAREPDHDSYWRFHRDLFLEIVPPPAGRTLDLGCGEGRLARDLARLGHDIVAVDRSPTMLAAARDAAPEMELELADAADLPFDDAAFGLVIAFMSLQDVDDLAGAMREIGRVLAPGGRLCLAIVHPLNSAGVFPERAADSPFVIAGSYLDETRTDAAFERDGLAMRFVSRHRPLQTYTEALAANGLLIERLREPPLPKPGYNGEYSLRWERIPLFLHLRAVKPA